PGLPDETISFSGFQGQKVQLIPSRDMVLVRFGRSEGPGTGDVYKRFIADAYALALEEGRARDGDTEDTESTASGIARRADSDGTALER
ncbi:MAG: hypothetical protein AAF991_13615, partial [Pseudomonadota bacterium]